MVTSTHHVCQNGGGVPAERFQRRTPKPQPELAEFRKNPDPNIHATNPSHEWRG